MRYLSVLIAFLLVGCNDSEDQGAELRSPIVPIVEVEEPVIEPVESIFPKVYDPLTGQMVTYETDVLPFMPDSFCDFLVDWWGLTYGDEEIVPSYYFINDYYQTKMHDHHPVTAFISFSYKTGFRMLHNVNNMHVYINNLLNTHSLSFYTETGYCHINMSYYQTRAVVKDDESGRHLLKGSLSDFPFGFL
jgi:hypothetical protein